MNARRLSHLKKAGASAALEIARQDVLADIQKRISLSTLDMACKVLAILAQLTLLICKCVLRVARGTLTARTLARLYGDSNVPQPSFSPLYS